MRRRRPTLTPLLFLAAGLGSAVPGQGIASDAVDGPHTPVQWVAQYTADLFHNARRGLRRGTAYLDYAEFAVGYDAARASGGGALRLYASVAHVNSTTFSDVHTGDALVASNIDSDHSPGVLEAWCDWGYEARGRGSLRLGLYDLNSEFDALESRGLFLNSAYGIGQDLAQTGANGPSIFPTTALAARVAWSSHPRWLLKAAVLDAVPGDPDGRDRSRFHLSGSEGALWIAEITADAGPARLAAGHWRYTRRFEAWTAADAAGGPPSQGRSAGTYANAELASRRAPGDGEPRWRAFLRVGTAEPGTNPFDRFVATGIVRRNDWPGTRGSLLGLAAAQARVGGPFRAHRARLGLATDRHERNLELTWRIPVGERVVLQPDLQFLVNPGAEPAVRDALVVGLRVELQVSN